MSLANCISLQSLGVIWDDLHSFRLTKPPGLLELGCWAGARDSSPVPIVYQSKVPVGGLPKEAFRYHILSVLHRIM